MNNISEYSGYVCIDGKEIKVCSDKITLLWACDSKNHKLLCYLLAKKENKESTLILLEILKNILPSDILGITTDFGRGRCFIKPIKQLFTEAIHQICIVHYSRYLRLIVPQTKKSKYFWKNKILQKTVMSILYAPSLEIAQNNLLKLLKVKRAFRVPYQKKIIRSIEQNFKLLTAYISHPEIPYTSNSIEAWNRQLERKLKNTDSFKSMNSLKNFMKIWL